MHMWTALSSEQRARIRSIFSIPRSSHVEVSDGKIITDGTTSKDFETLTTEKMKSYLKNNSNDFHFLFDLVVAKVQDEIEGKSTEQIILSTEPLTVVIPPKKKGRPLKK